MRKSAQTAKRKSLKGIDWHFYYLACLFLLIGIVIIYTSAIVHSQSVFGDPFRFFILHILWVIVGLGFMVFFSFFDYKILTKFSRVLYFTGLGFLFVLAISGLLPCSTNIIFAPCSNEANRWFYFNPAPLPQIPFVGELGFQPSELAKIVIIFYLAVKLARQDKQVKQRQETGDSFWAYLFATGLFSALILLQPNMSTAIMIFGIGTIMYISSGATLKPLVILMPVALFLTITFILVSPYRRERLLTFINRNDHVRSLDEDYQIRQVKLALGAGGLFGVGYGQSRQRFYIPEIASDSIFAIIGEEFGFVGSLAVLALFLYFVYKGFMVANTCADPVDSLLAIGITSWIGLQFLFHLAANSGLFPYTGVPLPLISYGGTSMVFTLIGFGILVNISRKSQLNDRN